MSHFHPSHDQLLDFASGCCSQAMSVGISAHIHFCAQCRREIRENESVGSALFEQQAKAKLKPGSFENLMQKINTVQPHTELRESKKSTPYRFPPVVEKLIHSKVEDLAWTNATKNLRVSTIMKDEHGLIVGLHHMKSGGRVPRHSHRGNEISIVLEGGFSDELGSYRAGDYIHLSSQHMHSPQADADGDCWLLTLVEAPIKLSGPLGWVLNPFLKV